MALADRGLLHKRKSEGLKNACQQNTGITYYGNDDSSD
jgi:hypothetical protein